MIEADNLTKDFRVAKHRRGVVGTLRNLVSREATVVRAVDHVSFAIGRGEMVGYIGPNGAGKSTSIKMLTGILVPTGGQARVCGCEPYRHRRENARRIGVVFGRRTHLWWDLPVIESFELLRHMYRVPPKRYRENLDTFDDLLGLSAFFSTPVRQLSLGQRMRADIAAALLHDPEVLFLDEPTIGLDVVAKEKVREFIRTINRERQVTILLTTHDLSDVEKLCERVIVIDRARVIFDGRLEEIRRRFDSQRLLVVDYAESYEDVSVPGTDLLEREGQRATYRLGRDAAPAVMSEVLQRSAWRIWPFARPRSRTWCGGCTGSGGVGGNYSGPRRSTDMKSVAPSLRLSVLRTQEAIPSEGRPAVGPEQRISYPLNPGAE